MVRSIRANNLILSKPQVVLYFILPQVYEFLPILCEVCTHPVRNCTDSYSPSNVSWLRCCLILQHIHKGKLHIAD